MLTALSIRNHSDPEMAPKGGNAKKESGRAKKADNENKKAAAAAEERVRLPISPKAESQTQLCLHSSAAYPLRTRPPSYRNVRKPMPGPDKDVKGAKAKKADAEEKRKAELARKAENARLLAVEEASQPAKVKAAPKAGSKGKQPIRPAGPGAIAAGGGLASGSESPKDAPRDAPHEEPESYTATGIDNALDLMEIVTAKMDKASVGQQAAGLERHPERRFKGALEAYTERELPKLRVDHPGLRLQQYKVRGPQSPYSASTYTSDIQDLIYKQFQKSPENPYNQTTVSYDASKEEKLEALNKKKAEVEQRLREKRG
ncbi:hypothetical protein D9611_014970 [Ephemerocybe angulata]|uniref:Coiled-coil domain-containing protein n=1 Tax=Ephemerocybe angulata TaxID=980116 RepID=A0A8H5EYU9_9AGAR|nr:hypothetical protein D9611_014970 [Tulosesus angulatus]